MADAVTDVCQAYKAAALTTLPPTKVQVDANINQALADVTRAQQSLTWWNNQSPTAACAVAFQALVNTLQSLLARANELGQRLFTLDTLIRNINCSSTTWATDVVTCENMRAAIVAETNALSNEIDTANGQLDALLISCTMPLPPSGSSGPSGPGSPVSPPVGDE